MRYDNKQALIDSFADHLLKTGYEPARRFAEWDAKSTAEDAVSYVGDQRIKDAFKIPEDANWIISGSGYFGWAP